MVWKVDHHPGDYWDQAASMPQTTITVTNTQGSFGLWAFKQQVFGRKPLSGCGMVFGRKLLSSKQFSPENPCH